MYNALQTMPDLNAPLRPLLRPLPTPEQSPVVISISRSSSLGYSTLPTPATVFPQGPAPTPIRRTASNPFRLISDTVPPSPSPYFPRDMTTLFALNPEETKRLLREYGLTSATTSPTAEHPTRPRGLSIVNEDAAEEDPDIHARDLNKFMAHIGVRSWPSWSFDLLVGSKHILNWNNPAGPLPDDPRAQRKISRVCSSVLQEP